MIRRALASAALALTLLRPAPAHADGQTFWGVTTAYCLTGTTASGRWTAWGTAAGAAWLPLGSLVAVEGAGTLLIDDRGAPGLFDIDIAAPGACDWALRWGRQWRRIQVLRWGWASMG